MLGVLDGAVLIISAAEGVQEQEIRGSSYVLGGGIPVARVHEPQQLLPALTRGEGELECSFDIARCQPIGGKTPTRPRTDHNTLNRKQYLLSVMRRTAATGAPGGDG